MTLTEFQQFTGIPFNKEAGPTVLNGQEELTEGINCQGLVHKIYNYFGHNLPPSFRSREIFEDEELFFSLSLDNLDPFSLAKLDILIFGRQDVIDFRKLHLSVYTGELDKDQNPLIIHSTRVEQQVVIWPLQKFFTFPKYEKLYAIKRLKICYITNILFLRLKCHLPNSISINCFSEGFQ